MRTQHLQIRLGEKERLFQMGRPRLLLLEGRLGSEVVLRILIRMSRNDESRVEKVEERRI